jgi:hypothetical protein
MAVGSSFTPGTGGGNIGGFPQTQTGGGVRETPQERRDRIAAEERQEVLNDPYGLRQQNQPGQTGGTTRTVRKKVRVRRTTGEAVSTNDTSSSNQTGQTGRTQRNQGPQGTYHMLRNSTLGQSSLVRASVLFQNNQAQNLPQPQSNLGVRNKMLMGLNNYIQNDYQMMKLNPDDKAFTYRTAEARQLGATIGQMVASTSRQATNANKSNDETPTTRLTPEAYGRQKGLLRRLAAMSEPNPKLPDNLPTNYQPFESVA